MSASPANPKSLHGFPTRVTQVSAKTTDFNPKSETKSERISASASGSPSTETVAVVANRAVASRSSRQPRLSFSSFAPSSENDYPKKLTREGVPASEEEEEEKRKWNLRPRKGFGGGGGGGGASSEVKNQKSSGGGGEAKSNRQRGIPAESPGLGGGVEVVTNENHRLWIALSRDEIEEDLFSMSGNRASRRPRKRTKTLQKYLDVIFPGLCLVGMNADCFRVSNSPSKR